MRTSAILIACLGFGVASWADTLRVFRLYTGAGDITRFEETSLAWESPDIADGAVSAAGLSVTALLPATHVGFLRIPAGYRSDWHPAPRKQYIMVLDGLVEVESGAGTRITFEPGSVLLVEDVSGRGHRTNVLGGQDALVAWVPVP